MTATTDAGTLTHNAAYPQGYTRGGIAWLPWLDPLPYEELTERHYEGLVDRSRDRDAYFMLLVRNPDILRARTHIESDIFFDTTEGLSRGERELAATAVSRLDGCVRAVSGHGDHAANFSDRAEDVDRLVFDGFDADLGERWNAIVAASVALGSTPVAFTEEHVTRLRAAGLDDAEIADVIHSAAFMAWATRLVMSLGRPVAPDPVDPA